MKVKLLTIISFLIYQLSISQTENLLNGKVVDQNSTLKGVEVINKTSKTSTRTNELGQFSILVNPRDSLLFFHKNYFFKRLKITPENIMANNLVVQMIVKPEELNEVILTKVKIDVKHEEEALAKIDVEKRKKDLRRFIPVNDGTIANGINVLGSGPNIFDLFRKKEPKVKTKATELSFLKLLEITVPLDFYFNNLKLKPEERDLFLQFCDADPQAKIITEKKNLLYTIDFLYKKNEEFQKLNSGIKN